MLGIVIMSCTWHARVAFGQTPQCGMYTRTSVIFISYFFRVAVQLAFGYDALVPGMNPRRPDEGSAAGCLQPTAQFQPRWKLI